MLRERERFLTRRKNAHRKKNDDEFGRCSACNALFLLTGIAQHLIAYELDDRGLGKRMYNNVLAARNSGCCDCRMCLVLARIQRSVKTQQQVVVSKVLALDTIGSFGWCVYTNLHCTHWIWNFHGGILGRRGIHCDSWTHVLPKQENIVHSMVLSCDNMYFCDALCNGRDSCQI